MKGSSIEMFLHGMIWKKGFILKEEFWFPINLLGLFNGRIDHAGKIVFASGDSFKTLTHPRNL